MNFDEYLNTLFEEDILNFLYEGKISGGVYKNKSFDEVINIHIDELKKAKAAMMILPQNLFKDLSFLEIDYKIFYKNTNYITIIIFGIK
jgi:hypothetical protein